MEDQKIFIRFPFGPGLSPYLHQLKLYTTCLKNWFLTASAFSQNSHLHSRLVHAQWSLVPDQNFEKPSCQIPNFSDTLCITLVAKSIFKLFGRVEWIDVIEGPNGKMRADLLCLFYGCFPFFY